MRWKHRIPVRFSAMEHHSPDTGYKVQKISHMTTAQCHLLVVCVVHWSIHLNHHVHVTHTYEYVSRRQVSATLKLIAVDLNTQ